jgi:hypothetical protein
MSAYKDVERLASEKLLGALPRELQGSYRPLLCEIDPERSG